MTRTRYRTKANKTKNAHVHASALPLAMISIKTKIGVQKTCFRPGKHRISTKQRAAGIKRKRVGRRIETSGYLSRCFPLSRQKAKFPFFETSNAIFSTYTQPFALKTGSPESSRRALSFLKKPKFFRYTNLRLCLFSVQCRTRSFPIIPCFFGSAGLRPAELPK